MHTFESTLTLCLKNMLGSVHALHQHVSNILDTPLPAAKMSAQALATPSHNLLMQYLNFFFLKHAFHQHKEHIWRHQISLGGD